MISILLAVIFFTAWGLFIADVFWKPGTLRTWAEGVLISGYAGQVIVLGYNFIFSAKSFGCPRLCVMNSAFYRVVFVTALSFAVFLWMYKRYRQNYLVFMYIPVHAAVLCIISRCAGQQVLLLPKEKDIFMSGYLAMTLVSHAFGIIAGMLGIVWLYYLIGSSRMVKRKIKAMSASSAETVLKLMRWLVGLLVPFLVTGIFFYCVWMYRTQGLLWPWDTKILLQFLLGLNYLAYIQGYSISERASKRMAAVPVIGFLIIIWFHAQ